MFNNRYKDKDNQEALKKWPHLATEILIYSDISLEDMKKHFPEYQLLIKS